MQPDVVVQAVEPETAAPLAASIVAGRPCEIDYQASFVDGAGGRAVLPTMWPLVRGLIQGAMRVTLEETAAAVRLLVERNQVVAEGAGALAVAAALKGQLEARKVVCVVSGGNIDAAVLAEILKPGKRKPGETRFPPGSPLLVNTPATPPRPVIDGVAVFDAPGLGPQDLSGPLHGRPTGRKARPEGAPGAW